MVRNAQFVSVAFAATLLASAEGAPFERVAEIFASRCLACHSDAERQGDFSLQSATALFGSGYLEPGDADASGLLHAIADPSGGSPRMPKDGAPLDATQIAAVRDWIAAGAPWPKGRELQAPAAPDFEWWSYRTLTLPGTPDADGDAARGPIDAFLRRRITTAGLTPAPTAERRTLIRRVTYDLIGLPPTFEEVEAFVADPRPDAYERLVDRLLASPRYGEKQARHWLDVVKYADTHGYDKDKLRPHAWPYRDYVIRSLNEDKPYARFVREQVAGDALYPGEADGIIALGFLAAGPWDFIGHVEVPETKIDGRVARNLDRDDMVSNTVNTFCSLTVQCARCHDHKFDPITQEHYYGLQAVFAAVDRANRPYVVDEAAETLRGELRTELAELRERLAKTPEDGAGRETLESTIHETEQRLAGLPEQQLVYAAATEFASEGSFHPTHGEFRAVHVLHRGDVTAPREAATPGALPLPQPIAWRIDADASDPERRAALARWLTDQQNPLVWRSIVNRVWQQHFGRGLVDTPNDFGRMGGKPTHPELLDWLAASFRDGGPSIERQSLKSLHRAIVTSNAYQQSSTANEATAATDGDNQLIARMSRRRLTAEELRDSVLAVSGVLDLTPGGPGFYLFGLEKTEHSPHYEYDAFDPADPATHRRSIYRFVVRSQPDPLMTTLDCADSSQSTPRRHESLTPLQALTLLNSRFTLTMAEAFAERLRREADGTAERVDLAVRLALQRPATREERERLSAFAERHGLENACRLVFNLNEFVYVD